MTHTRMLTQGQVNPSELHSDRRNWTMVGLRDANGCASILDGVKVASLSTGTPELSECTWALVLYSIPRCSVPNAPTLDRLP